MCEGQAYMIYLMNNGQNMEMHHALHTIERSLRVYHAPCMASYRDYYSSEHYLVRM